MSWRPIENLGKADLPLHPESEKLRGVDRDLFFEFLLAQIPKREAFILERVVISNWTKASISRELKVSKTRVSQLIKQAFKHMEEIAKKYPQIR